MKIELKRISHNARLSEETECFSADLYLDGVKRGEVSNRGHGGPDNFTDRKAEQELDAYGKTLPPEPKYGLTMSAELLVGEILTQHLEQAQYKRWCRTKIVFRMPGDKEGEWRTIKHAWDDKARAHMAAKFPGAEILNERFSK